jgi:hypothetical protein
MCKYPAGSSFGELVFGISVGVTSSDDGWSKKPVVPTHPEIASNPTKLRRVILLTVVDPVESIYIFCPILDYLDSYTIIST